MSLLPTTLIPAALAVTCLLAGCANTPTTYGQFVQSNYRSSQFGYAAGRRDLWTEIKGDPFEMGAVRFEAAMIDILGRHPPRPQPTHYTTEPGETARKDYRLVFLFHPPKGLLNRGICQSETEPEPVGAGSPPDDDGKVIYVAAAFCKNQGAITAVRGKLDKVLDVDDPTFEALIGQMVNDLFPNINSDQDDDPFFFRRR